MRPQPLPPIHAPIAIEDWLQQNHPRRYFHNLRYQAWQRDRLVNTLAPFDTLHDSNYEHAQTHPDIHLQMDYLEDCHQLYQAVIAHPRSNSALYRMREIEPIMNSIMRETIDNAHIYADQDETNASNQDTRIAGIISLSLKKISKRHNHDKIEKILLEDPIINAIMSNSNISVLSKQFMSRRINEYADNLKLIATVPTLNSDERKETLFKNIYLLYQEMLREHPLMREFYGTEFHRLSDTNGIYSLGKCGHTLDKNMVWLYANICAERPLKLGSKLDMDTLLRQTENYEDTPSAFANEIAGLVTAGYALGRSGNGYILLPPNPSRNIQLQQIQKDMNNIYHRISVLDNVLTVLKAEEAMLMQDREQVLSPNSELVLERRLFKNHAIQARIQIQAEKLLGQLETELKELANELNHTHDSSSLPYFKERCVDLFDQIDTIKQFGKQLNGIRIPLHKVDLLEEKLGDIANQVQRAIDKKQALDRRPAADERKPKEQKRKSDDRQPRVAPPTSAPAVQPNTTPPARSLALRRTAAVANQQAAATPAPTDKRSRTQFKQ